MSMVKNILRESGIRLLPCLLKLLVASLQIRIIPPENGMPEKKEAVLFTFWHGKMITGWLLGKRLFPDRPLSAVVSLSGDGQILAGTLDRLGFRLIRGSSSRGRQEVRTGIGEALSRHGVVAITPDGPRGPLHQFKYGTIRLASEHKTCLLCAVITHERMKMLRSWDRFEIPLPFSKVTVELYRPEIPEFPDEESLHNYADQLSRRFADVVE
jgi:lysophospholipid acyltransferase (LPLAT)-like uncharacterized protein